MRRIRKYSYGVKHNEKVIFTINPINGATPKVTAAQNGSTLRNRGNAKPRFEFGCNEVVGNRHFVMIEFSFLRGDPEDAEFELVLRSGKGEKFDDFPNIKKKNQTRETNFNFKVESM